MTKKKVLQRLSNVLEFPSKEEAVKYLGEGITYFLQMSLSVNRSNVTLLKLGG